MSADPAERINSASAGETPDAEWVDPGPLAAAVDDVAGPLAAESGEPGLVVRVLNRAGVNPVLSVEYDERWMRVPLARIASVVARHPADSLRPVLIATVREWVNRRPASDREAAQQGVAVVDWADPDQTRVGWRIVVPRPDRPVPWTPSPWVTPTDLVCIRHAATIRSFDTPVTVRHVGEVAVISHPQVPILAAAALASPERLLAAWAQVGEPAADPVVVLSPPRPVAVAAAAVAARLAGETSEAHVVVPLHAVGRLPWVTGTT